MNCSCTQMNRSSRAKPRFTSFWSGATDTGLVFWMISAVDRRPAAERIAVAVRIAPMRDWSSMRTLGSQHIEALDHRLVEPVDVGIVVERAAAFVAARRR